MDAGAVIWIGDLAVYLCDCTLTNLGVDMARFTQFHLMIPRWAIIYKIISPGATGSSI